MNKYRFTSRSLRLIAIGILLIGVSIWFYNGASLNPSALIATLGATAQIFFTTLVVGTQIIDSQYAKVAEHHLREQTPAGRLTRGIIALAFLLALAILIYEKLYQNLDWPVAVDKALLPITASVLLAQFFW